MRPRRPWVQPFDPHLPEDCKTVQTMPQANLMAPGRKTL